MQGPSPEARNSFAEPDLVNVQTHSVPGGGTELELTFPAALVQLCGAATPVTAKYALGVDFGTESGRTVIVDVAHGRELATAVYKYANGVIDERLPTSGARLPPDWALQDPADYLRTLTTTIPLVLQEAGVSADDVLGIGIDFTACTMLPVDAAGQGAVLGRRASKTSRTPGSSSGSTTRRSRRPTR